MKTTLSVATALLASSWIGAYAADSAGNYAVWGVGHASCNQFVNAYDKDAAQAFKNFLAGYLTAFNTLTDGVHQVTGENTIADNLKALRTHCDIHRMDSFELAIRALIEQRAAARARAADAPSQSWGRPLPPAHSGS